MERRKTENIGLLIRQFLRSEGLETPYNEYKVVAAWPHVVGDRIAKMTGEVYLKNQTLYVKVKSPVIKNELVMSRKKLANALNEYVGAYVISDVMFY